MLSLGYHFRDQNARGPLRTFRPNAGAPPGPAAGPSPRRPAAADPPRSEGPGRFVPKPDSRRARLREARSP